MAERLVVLQSNSFETFFLAPDPQFGQLRPIEQIDGLTPYGMLLASLGSSTATHLNAFAQTHGLDLQHIELRLQYGPLFQEGSDDVREKSTDAGRIEAEIILYGNLSAEERDILLGIAGGAGIHNMLNHRMAVKPLLGQNVPTA